MDEDDLDELVARLDEFQDRYIHKLEQADSPESEAYFNGKDIGMAEAKDVLRRYVGEGSDE